jgi:hypothetical protein
LDHRFEGIDTALVASQSGQMALLRPSPVTVHHDSDVPGQLFYGGHLGGAWFNRLFNYPDNSA